MADLLTPGATEKEEVVHLRIKKDWKEKLKYLAEVDDSSISKVIRVAIQQMFHRRHETLTPSKKKSAP